MDGGTAFELVGRHADNWGDVTELMEAWLRANRGAGIERNRAAIAELVGALRKSIACLSGEQDTDKAHQHAMTIGRAAITKYDTPTTTKGSN